MIHELKTWPELYQAVARNAKTVEVRKNDRNFAVGDVLDLREFDPNTGTYTGARCERSVSHIVNGGQLGIEVGYVAMSITDDFDGETGWTPGNQGW